MAKGKQKGESKERNIARAFAEENELDSVQIHDLLEGLADNYRVSFTIESSDSGESVLTAHDDINGIQKGRTTSPAAAINTILNSFEAPVAVGILETRDAYLIGENEVAFLNLKVPSRTLPLYDLDELGNLARAYRDYLDYNRTLLCKRGVPQYLFIFDPVTGQPPSKYMDIAPIDYDRQLWLDPYLPQVYGNTRKSNYDRPSLTRDPEDSPLVKCLWLREGIKYQEGLPIEGLSTNETFRIESSRRKLLNFYIAALKEMETAILKRDNKKLLEKCFEHWQIELNEEDLLFFLQIDERLGSHSTISKYGHIPPNHPVLYGNVSDIILKALYIEEELSLGVYSSLRDMLNPIVTYSLNLRPTIDLITYHSSIGTGLEKTLENALRYLTNEAGDKLNEFWSQLNDRVHGLTSIPKGQSASISPPSPSDQEYVFKHGGRCFNLVFEGKPGLDYVNDTVGMHYIAILLNNPKKEFTPEDLWGARNNVSVIEESFLGQIDMKAKKEWGEKLSELSADREQAKSNNDQAWLARIDEEFSKIEDELNGSRHPSGKIKNMDGEARKRLRSVSEAIRRDLVKRIMPVHAELYRHLENTIQTGLSLSYTPNSDIDWQT